MNSYALSLSALTCFVLDEHFDPEFTDSSFGFRKGKSHRQAIWHLQALVNDAREWAVAVELRAFFDEISYDLMLKLIRCKNG